MRWLSDHKPGKEKKFSLSGAGGLHEGQVQ